MSRTESEESVYWLENFPMGSRNPQRTALVQRGRQHKMKISLVPWTGGKFRVVDTLYHLFPKYTSYYEPFFGSGAVLINKKRCQHETVSEYSRDLYMLHKVLSDPEKSRELRRRLRHQELNEEAFLKAKEILNEGKAQDDIEWAMCKYLRIVLSYNGMGEFYQPYLGRYFPSMIDWKLPIVTERYQGVDIRCQDGVELIREAKDKEDAFVFADPPYLLNLRGNKKIYDNEMGEKEHIQMLEYMQEAKCKIMLCGYYDSEKKGGDLYDRLLEYGWKRYKLADLVQSCSNQKKKGIGEEFIWVNYELPPQARFYIRMSTEVSKANKN